MNHQFIFVFKEDEREKRLHVEIKPLGNGTAPLSASVDELRSTVENMTLSPVGLSVRKKNFCFLLNQNFERTVTVTCLLKIRTESFQRMTPKSK